MNQEIKRGFKKENSDFLTLSLEPLEIALLTTLIEQIISLLELGESEKSKDPLEKIVGIDSKTTRPIDEVLLRLLPDAYQNDPEAADEFRRFTERSLRELKVRNAKHVLENLPEPDQISKIKAKDFQTWLTVLNDVRLALGTRIGIEDGFQDENEAETDHAQEIYSWLTWLQSNLLEELNK
jgi:hypothetical protein